MTQSGFSLNSDMLTQILLSPSPGHFRVLPATRWFSLHSFQIGSGFLLCYDLSQMSCSLSMSGVGWLANLHLASLFLSAR